MTPLRIGGNGAEIDGRMQSDCMQRIQGSFQPIQIDASRAAARDGLGERKVAAHMQPRIPGNPHWQCHTSRALHLQGKSAREVVECQTSQPGVGNLESMRQYNNNELGLPGAASPFRVAPVPGDRRSATSSSLSAGNSNRDINHRRRC